ncbi:MAG: hypothetical protein WKF66_13555 [Pedobacter sp.]
MEISITNDDLIYQIPDAEYTEDWLHTDNLTCKKLGDQLLPIINYWDLWLSQRSIS